MFSKNKNKIFVLDTNVVLYDYRSIYHFKEHNIVIPITLLEEVDKFKRGNEIINFNARQFTRELDNIIGNTPLSEGAKIKEGGYLLISNKTQKDGSLKDVFWEDTADHRILAVAHNLAKDYGKERVIVVSKDINLRMKAKSLELQAEDYETGKVKDIDELYKGKNKIENLSDAVVEKIYAHKEILKSEAGADAKPLANEFFILTSQSKSCLAQYKKEKDSFKLIDKRRAYGITPRNAEQTFSLEALMDKSVSLVTLSGKAGTGKTLMALAGALESRNDYKLILLARPIIPLSNRDLGYLPGDINSKIDPYMQPLYDNLSVIQHQFGEDSHEFTHITEMRTKQKLVIMPLAYIRGRSLSKCFFIIDEAQNLTPHEVKTIITRAGEGTKIVFTGDPYQIDTPYLDSRSNGLTFLIDKMKGQEIYAHVTLEKGERSHLAELASDLL